MKTYNSQSIRIDYAPPILANGEMALQLDFMGQMDFDPKELDQLVYGDNPVSDTISGNLADPGNKWLSRTVPTRFIWWEGRRYLYDMRRFLIPFGRITVDAAGIPSRPEAWEQTLDTDGARMMAECSYADDVKMRTEAFVHHDANVLSIRRQYKLEQDTEVTYTYYLTDNKADTPDKLPRYMTLQPQLDPLTGGWLIRYQVIGQHDYEGVIRIFTDCPVQCAQDGNRFTLTYKVKANGDEWTDPVCFYAVLRDNVNEEDYEAVEEKQVRTLLEQGFDASYQVHRAQWEKFYAESDVQLPDQNLMDVYKAALYDMKCYTTRWSIPVGICDTYWEGKFFAYDEYFSLSGLISGNHRDLSVRVPKFRKAGLQQAIQRMSSRGMQEARYVWETSETGEEAAIPGFWYEHIFHMANISVGAWEYFAMTNDVEFLRETAWPVMRAVSEFYLRHMVYRIEGGKTIIGRVTDWERLGSSVQNPYMTTCGVIRTLQVTMESAKILDLDPEFVVEAQKIADELMEGLPHDDEKYIPHPGCTQKSIGVYGGMFPYLVMTEENPLQRTAIEDYRKYEGTYGNMYAVGSGVSSWFAAWKGITYARIHEPIMAMASVRQSASSAGCFGELFEINEKRAIYRPWFSTANGIFVNAVNNMLLQSRNWFYDRAPQIDAETAFVDVLPGWPQEEGDTSFRLPAEGDLMVTVETKDSKLVKFAIEKGPRCTLKKVTLRFPAWLDQNIGDTFTL